MSTNHRFHPDTIYRIVESISETLSDRGFAWENLHIQDPKDAEFCQNNSWFLDKVWELAAGDEEGYDGEIPDRIPDEATRVREGDDLVFYHEGKEVTRWENYCWDPNA